MTHYGLLESHIYCSQTFGGNSPPKHSKKVPNPSQNMKCNNCVTFNFPRGLPQPPCAFPSQLVFASHLNQMPLYIIQEYNTGFFAGAISHGSTPWSTLWCPPWFTPWSTPWIHSLIHFLIYFLICSLIYSLNPLFDLLFDQLLDLFLDPLLDHSIDLLLDLILDLLLESTP